LARQFTAALLQRVELRRQARRRLHHRRAHLQCRAGRHKQFFVAELVAGDYRGGAGPVAVDLDVGAEGHEADPLLRRIHGHPRHLRLHRRLHGLQPADVGDVSALAG
jgi:hypothetical protein